MTLLLTSAGIQVGDVDIAVTTGDELEQILSDKNIVTLSEYAKMKKISHTNLLNKTNRQSIEVF